MLRLLAALAVCVALAPLTAFAQNNTRCAANPYALCSHAICTCLDESGNPTACPTSIDDATKAVWSSCECPVVTTGPAPNYNVNLGNTACEKRLPTAIPGFAVPSRPTGNVNFIFSQYSLGDAVTNSNYGTLSGASMTTCPATNTNGSPTFFANCLDAPCYWDPSEAKAVCFCPVNIATATWNTFTTDCGTDICETADNQVWSAAPVPLTQTATGLLQGTIAAGGNTPATVNYCVPN